MCVMVIKHGVVPVRGKKTGNKIKFQVWYR